MRRHSHRHRSASRRPTLFRRVASATFFVIGICALIGLCLLTPTGRFLLMCAAVIPALAALVWLSYVTGRAAANIRNSFAREAGRTNLEKIMRAQRPAQHSH